MRRVFGEIGVVDAVAGEWQLLLSVAVEEARRHCCARERVGEGATTLVHQASLGPKSAPSSAQWVRAAATEKAESAIRWGAEPSNSTGVDP
jgi:hypothetical protein